MELISIIMPTFKNEGFALKRAIDSVLNQTYDNWELIIVDDNQDSKYSKIVQTIVSDYLNNKIKYFKNQENLGSAKSRNLGIDYAKGKYITFLDDDDLYLPKKIENQINVMKINDADFSIGNLDLKNQNEKVVRRRRHQYLENFKAENLLKYHLKYHLTGTDTLMFKKEYILKIGKFDEIDIGDEYYLMLKAILNKGKCAYVNSVDVVAYIHDAGIGLTASSKKIQGEINLYNKKKQFFSTLSKKDIRFIKMRHNLVLLSCQIKNKNTLSLIVYIFKAFFSCPGQFIKFAFNRKEY
ncbi:MAG: glycosyltransferase family 2 protein [Thomasclavelia sp.]